MKIAKLIVDSSEKCSDLFYKVGIFTPDAFIYFETDDEKGAILSSLEYDRAVALGNNELTYYQNEFFNVGSNPVAIIKKLAELKSIDKFITPKNFPLYLADCLRHENIDIHANPDNFCPEREFKSLLELREVECAMVATESGMYRAYEILNQAKIDNNNHLVWQNELLSSEILRFEIEMVILKNGATPQNTIVASGLQGAQPHNSGSGLIKANSPIVIDIFPRLNDSGYYGDLTRTYVKGKSDKIVKKAYNAVVEARDNAKSILKANITYRQAYELAKSTLENHGFSTGVNSAGGNYGFFHSLGHGVGLDIHESPRLSNIDGSLQGGEIVTVEPGLYYPEWGGIRMEDIVYIRKEDAYLITKIGDDFEID